MQSRYVATIILFISVHHTAISMPGVEATEYTQILNHEALLREIHQISSLVAEQQRIKKVMLDQYRLAQSQAKKLSPEHIERLIKQSLSIDKFIKELHTFEDYSNRYTEMISRRSREISALHIDPKKYIEEEINLANELGGIYKKTMENDIDTMRSLEEKSSSLSDDIISIENISGPTEGLQSLSLQLNNLNHHIKNLEKIILYQNIDKSTTLRRKNQQNMYSNLVIKNYLDVQNRRKYRDHNLKKQEIVASWNYSSNSDTLEENDSL